MHQDERFWVEEALGQLRDYGHSFISRRAAVRSAEELLAHALTCRNKESARRG